MKKRWLIPLFLVLILAIATFGASAYFNSPRETTGNISSGDLELKLSLVEGGPWENNVPLPWNFTNMAPGQVVEGDLWMKNVGSIDAQQVTFEWKNISNPTFADHIFLIHAWDSINTADAIGGFIAMADGKMPGTVVDGKVSLNEVAYLSTNYGWPFDATSDPRPSPTFLPSNVPAYLHLAFQFDPLADNTFMNQSLVYGLRITAEQVQVFPTTP